MLVRKLSAELLGTALLVFVGVGAATLAFGFGLHGGSYAAGVVMTALAFGLVLMALVYAIGPVSGCHVNPAVTLAFVVAKRMPLKEGAGYWGAQVIGGIIGALALWAMLSTTEIYSREVVGLGTDGWGANSLIGLGAGGAFLAEGIMSFAFVLVVLLATRHATTASLAGVAIGAGLLVVNLACIPLTGCSVNPARSIGPALVIGGDALRQLWLFIVAPLVGGALAAACSRFLIASRPAAIVGRVDAAPLSIQPPPVTNE